MATEKTGEQTAAKPEGYAGWLTLAEAAAKSNLSPSSIRGYAAKGKIRSAQVGTAVLYDPETLPGTIDDSALSEVIKVQTAALREAHEQIGRLTDKVIGMTGFVDRVINALEHEAEGQRNRNVVLEGELRAGRELVDRMQTQEEERRQARAAFDEAQERARKAFDKFLQLADPVASALMFHFAPGARSVQDSFVAKLIERFDAEEIQAISNHPKIDKIERTALLELWRKLRAAKDERDAAAKKAAEGAAAEGAAKPAEGSAAPKDAA